VAEHPAKERALGLLIFENEIAIAQLLQLFLSRKDFSVWVTSQFEEALELYRKHAAEIDVVLSDVALSGHEGLQLLAELRRLNPAVCFCFLTGENADYSPADLFATGANRVFPKPFTSLEQLANEVRDLAMAARAGTVATNDP